LDLFLQYVGLDEEEFLDIAMSHGVSPYKHDPSKVTFGKKTHDFDEWPRQGAMPRSEAQAQLERWKLRNNP
jgi:hypothetical protein